MFGPPATDVGIGYGEKKEKMIQEMCGKIKKQTGTDGNIYFKSICVFWADLDFKEAKVETIFRISKNEKSNKHVFIDERRRVYKDWDDFISNNKLPKCWMCFPVDGIYTADKNNLVKVIFQKSCACGVWRQTANVISGIAVGAMLASTAVVGATLFTPVAAPLLLASTVFGVGGTGYTLGESICTIVDRSKHDQSII
jgi:hypothetical protein